GRSPSRLLPAGQSRPRTRRAYRPAARPASSAQAAGMGAFGDLPLLFPLTALAPQPVIDGGVLLLVILLGLGLGQGLQLGDPDQLLVGGKSLAEEAGIGPLLADRRFDAEDFRRVGCAHRFRSLGRVHKRSTMHLLWIV